MDQKLFSKKARISYLQIVLLVTSIFAFTYLIYSASNVKAQDGDLGFKCCEKTEDGAICQDIVDEDECAYGLYPTECEFANSQNCKKGCCIDDYEGTYDPSPKINCDDIGGRWVEDSCDNIPESRLGCCILEGVTEFVTERRCTLLSELGGIDKNYDSDKGGSDCALIPTLQEKGACVYENGFCSIKTKQECIKDRRSDDYFFKDYLCTSDDLKDTVKDYYEIDLICNPTEKTMCVEGRDEVFFKDSCNNPANIYDAEKVDNSDYWEKIVSKEDSCNANDKNANSEDCGNCQRIESICRPAKPDGFESDFGYYYCKKTDCIDNKGNVRKNQESWCVYEGKIGEGDDIVGSEHWRYNCNYGEIEKVACGTGYRQYVCVQQDTIVDKNTGEKISDANCRINNWRTCIDYNSGSYSSEMGRLCSENPYCEVRHIELSESLEDVKFDYYTPKYPAGFDLSNNNNAALCSLVSNVQCTKMEQKHFDFFGFSWKCHRNCNCGDWKDTQDLNEFCKSLGDCGLNVNVEGDLGTRSYSISTLGYYLPDGEEAKRERDDSHIAPMNELTSDYINNLIKMKNAIQGQKIGPEDIILEDVIALAISDTGAGLSTQAMENAQRQVSEMQSLGMGIGGAGYLTAAGLGAFAGVANPTTYMFSYLWETGATTTTGAFGGGLVGQSFAYIADGAMGIGASMIAAAIISWAFGLNPEASRTMSQAGITVGVGAMIITAFSESLAGCAASGPAFLICVGILAAFAALLSMAGIGDIRETTYTFNCNQWNPPYGGDKCELCNNNLDFDCSEYRCLSLGATCGIVNKGTKDEKCIDKSPNDITPPEFEGGWDDVLSEDCKYERYNAQGLKITELDGSCLGPNQWITLGFKTNELAQCVYDTEMKEFDEMQDFGTNRFVYDHALSYRLNDPSSGQSQGLDITSDIKLYIKCRDGNGKETPEYYTIDMCIEEGEDTTAPYQDKFIFKPETQTYIGYNTEYKLVALYTNEQSECKWSKEDKSYDEMENKAWRYSGLGGLGWGCSLNLSTHNYGENKFFIRCKDQPWVNETEFPNKRNANDKSEIYILNRIETPITIDWVEPSEDILSGTESKKIELIVKTSGGAMRNTHKCSYELNDYSLVPLQYTFSYSHKQTGVTLFAGDNEIYVECEDIETGDKVNSTVNFKIIHDSDVPEVARVYEEGGKIKVVLTEEGECAYSTESCEFSFGDEDVETLSGSGTEHLVTMKEEITYHIKCKDGFGNTPEDCSIIVRADMFGL